jgi:hypothetical protein
MFVDGAAEGVRGVDSDNGGGCVVSASLPLAKIPLLREVVLIVGDGRREEDVGAMVSMLAAQMRVPIIAHWTGMQTLKVVWDSGCKMSPPLFFNGTDGLHHVESSLLAAVRAQTLMACRCGARYEVGATCYLCPNRERWDAETFHLLQRYGVSIDDG